jgi:hypothetical protein
LADTYAWAKTAPEQAWLVTVSSCRLPNSMPWYSRFAHHAWIDLRDEAGEWTRVEILGFPPSVHLEGIAEAEAFAARRFGREVHLLKTISGPQAKPIVARVLELADACEDYGRLALEWNEEGGFVAQVIPPSGRDYRRWPGPNSNTFVAWIIERTPGLHAELHHNAVGKDYPKGFRVGRTSAGYGFETESAWLGLGLGLSQGLELHLLGLTAGVDLWPPALKLPFLPRLGFPATNL